MSHQATRRPRPSPSVWTPGMQRCAERLLKGGKSLAKVADQLGVSKEWLKERLGR